MFPSEQIKIYLYQDLALDSLKVIQDIAKFLGVNDSFEPTLKRKNISGIPKNRSLQNLFTKNNPIKTIFKPLFPKSLRDNIRQGVIKINLGKKPQLNVEDRQKLIKIYQEDILQLQDLIQRDLSSWLQ